MENAKTKKSGIEIQSTYELTPSWFWKHWYRLRMLSKQKKIIRTKIKLKWAEQYQMGMFEKIFNKYKAEIRANLGSDRTTDNLSMNMNHITGVITSTRKEAMDHEQYLRAQGAPEELIEMARHAKKLGGKVKILSSMIDDDDDDDSDKQVH